ncbi:MAG: S8 family serine peptidase [Chloroflexota bacterium]|nr:S8 family serine peptidase [Chloroflexota bacterium]
MNRRGFTRVRKTAALLAAFAAIVPMATVGLAAKGADPAVEIGVALSKPATSAILAELGKYGTVHDVLGEINSVAMQGKRSAISSIRALSFVSAAAEDTGATGAPIDTVAAQDFNGGSSMWDMDAVNVTDVGQGRTVSYDGSGAYVAVLDSGLTDQWRQYFPQERIATQYARSFNGASTVGGGEPTNSWEHDQNSHGTHVTSSILGYSLNGQQITGVAPKATVIPVKVLNQNGSNWWTAISQGIVYAGNLKAGPLAAYPFIINMSIGGTQGSPVLERALNYAISKGAIIVVAAGNNGTTGMTYPGAYPQVISVANAGFARQWQAGSDGDIWNWWYADDVAENNVNEFFISGSSGRELSGQDLDVTGPGVQIYGPYQVQSGSPSYFFLNGTSMATPHVAGIVALMSQKNPRLTQTQVESILESAAARLPMNSGCRFIKTNSAGDTLNRCWGPGNDPAGQDADGEGFLTADNALTLTPRR